MRGVDARLLLLLLGVCVVLMHCRSEAHQHLDAVLHHYDTLHVDHLKHTLPTSTSHASSAHRLKREVEFYALEKKFQLHLLPHRGIFSQDFAAYAVDGSGGRTRHHVDLDEYYRGFLHDEKQSTVVAHLSKEGVLLAIIKTPSEIYHIEPSENYINTPHSFHMIAYRGSDVKRNSTSKIDYVRAPLTLESDEETETNSEPSSIHGDTSEFHKSSHRSKSGSPDSRTETLSSHFRLKRQSNLRGDLGGDNCRMILVADYLFFQRFVTEGSTIRTLVTLISAIDTLIYRPSAWIVSVDNDVITGLGLEIGEIRVHTAPYTTGFNAAPTMYYNSRVLSDMNPEAGDVLDAFNFGDWRGYCLAHLFTFRNFDSGLLGLANIASPRPRETGGICSDSFIISGRRIIYNTGLSTFNSDGNALVMEESRLVTGHELGHNWGSHHDPPACGDDFIMNEFAQDGSRESHMQFSSCSLRSIGIVLTAKGDCFRAPTAVCGDYQQQAGETCDAGPEGDRCCTSVTCMLTTGSACSDANDACCENCQIASNSTVCRFAGGTSLDCTLDTRCNGVSPECPSAPPAAPDSFCIGGLCVFDNFTRETTCTPICTTQEGRSSCVCSGANECLVCCEDANGLCAPAIFNMTTINLSNGAACSDGVCLDGSCTDQFQPQDTISRIFDIITNLDIDDLARFARENIVGCVLFFTVIFWIPASCCIHCFIDRKIWERFSHSRAHDHTDWFARRIHLLRDREREREPLMSNEEPLNENPDKPEYVPEPIDDQPLPPSFSAAVSSVEEPLTRTYI